ncbi:MAG: hypothetical protein ACT4OZ_10700 [Gemmatimonadota bacterium]
MNRRQPLKLEKEPPPYETPALSDRAFDNLQFIRETMERAGTFTAISGRGIMATGVLALAASAIAGQSLESPRWLGTWVAAAVAALVTSVLLTMRKASATRTPMSGPIARKLALAFFPALVAGAVFTAVALRAGWYAALPGTWLIMYGAAVMAGGALSAPIIPVMGASFMAVGAAALGLPVILGNVWSVEARMTLINLLMGLGFGGLHLAFGYAIARRFGG